MESAESIGIIFTIIACSLVGIGLVGSLIVLVLRAVFKIDERSAQAKKIIELLEKIAGEKHV